MRKSTLSLTLLALVAGTAATALAQGVPTTQPKFLNIFREQLKPGTAGRAREVGGGLAGRLREGEVAVQLHRAPVDHRPLGGLVRLPLANQAAYGEMMATEDKDPALAAELERLNKGDAEFRAEESALQAVAMPELSLGAFPAIGKMRYYEITTFRVRPGHYEAWVAATKAYMAASARSAPNASWRTYERGGRRPRRHLPRHVVGRVLRRVRQDDGRGRGRPGRA